MSAPSGHRFAGVVTVGAGAGVVQPGSIGCTVQLGVASVTAAEAVPAVRTPATARVAKSSATFLNVLNMRSPFLGRSELLTLREDPEGWAGLGGRRTVALSREDVQGFVRISPLCSAEIFRT